MSDSSSDSGENDPLQALQGSRFGKKDLSAESKWIIANVYGFFQNLVQRPDTLQNLNFKQVQKLCGDACGISRSSVQKVKKEMTAY